MRSAVDLVADPRIRLGMGAAATVITALSARQSTVGRCEARSFLAVNSLPDRLYRPVWAIMQLGTLGAAPAAAGVALLARDRQLAGRLLAAGACTWALAKPIKKLVRRPRPATLVSGTRPRGREASGLGYLSGHAGVAAALGVAAASSLRPAGRAAIAAAVPIVGLSRMYVGAHLPLDIAGGAALGIAVEAAIVLTVDLGGPGTRAGAPLAGAPRGR